jgi:cell division protein FtsN
MPATLGANGSPDPPAAEPQDESLFALDVGAYPDPDEARAERDRIVIATGLKGWLLPATVGGGQTYRVIIGAYRTRERAEVSASALLERDLAFEAQVIPLPPRRLRR